MPHFLTVSQPFKWHVFESRDVLINILIMLIIQVNKIHLIMANFENNPVSASTGTVKSQTALQTEPREYPPHSAPPQIPSHLPSRSKSHRTKNSNLY